MPIVTVVSEMTIEDFGAPFTRHEVNTEELVEHLDLEQIILAQLIPPQRNQFDTKRTVGGRDILGELFHTLLGPLLSRPELGRGRPVLFFTSGDGGQQTLSEMIRHDALLVEKVHFRPSSEQYSRDQLLL